VVQTAIRDLVGREAGLKEMSTLGVTMATWAPLEARAFQCIDRMGGIFWDSTDSHRAAGDTVLSGWTWERIRTAQVGYELGFITLWLAIAAAPALVLRKQSHAQPT